MLNNLIEVLENKGYGYKFRNLYRIDIEFIDFSSVIMILNNCYKVYIVDNNNDDDNIIEFKEFIYPINIINYIENIWEKFQYEKEDN